MFIKAFDVNDRLMGAEKIDDPVFVRWQLSNGLLVRCEENEAQGILSADGNTVYLINGIMPHGEKEPYAQFITEAEYNEIIAEDLEDESPEIPENTVEQPILTRAELTQKIAELEEQLTDTQIALCDVYEMIGGGI